MLSSDTFRAPGDVRRDTMSPFAPTMRMSAPRRSLICSTVISRSLVSQAAGRGQRFEASRSWVNRGTIHFGTEPGTRTSDGSLEDVDGASSIIRAPDATRRVGNSSGPIASKRYGLGTMPRLPGWIDSQNGVRAHGECECNRRIACYRDGQRRSITSLPAP